MRSHWVHKINNNSILSFFLDTKFSASFNYQFDYFFCVQVSKIFFHLWKADPIIVSDVWFRPFHRKILLRLTQFYTKNNIKNTNQKYEHGSVIENHFRYGWMIYTHNFIWYKSDKSNPFKSLGESLDEKCVGDYLAIYHSSLAWKSAIS